MKGFYARLQSELLELMTSNPYSSKLGSIKSVKFFLLPNTRIELYGNWLGGYLFYWKKVVLFQLLHLKVLSFR